MGCYMERKGRQERARDFISQVCDLATEETEVNASVDKGNIAEFMEAAEIIEGDPDSADPETAAYFLGLLAEEDKRLAGKTIVNVDIEGDVEGEIERVGCLVLEAARNHYGEIEHDDTRPLNYDSLFKILGTGVENLPLFTRMVSVAFR